MPVLDTGARGSTVTFAQKELGDVLLAWENEAFLVLDEFGADNFDIVYPPMLDPRRTAGRHRRQERRSPRHRRSRQGLPRVSLFARGPDAGGEEPLPPVATRSVVTDQALLAAFPKIDLISIDDPLFGGWKTAQPKHFGDGGIFDQVYTPAQ